MKYALGNMLNGAGGLNADQLALDLQFAADKTLTARKGPTPIFTRASSGTFVGSNGLIQSAGNDVARFDHDPVTLASKGLLIEESRTNLVFPSDTLTTQTRTVTAVAHTLSFYGTGTVVLSGTHIATVVGTGAYPTRTTLTFTPTAGSLTLTVTGSVTQAQLEAGSFATSYIPTTTSALTRSSDVCSITGGDFTNLWNTSEGTMFGDFSMVNGYSITGRSLPIFWASNGTFNDSVRIGSSTGSLSLLIDSTISGTLTRAISSVAISLSSRNKTAGAYKVGDNGISTNGSVVVTASPAAISTLPNRIDIGGAHPGSGVFPLNGHIAAIRYYKKRLTNAKLVTLTT